MCMNKLLAVLSDKKWSPFFQIKEVIRNEELTQYQGKPQTHVAGSIWTKHWVLASKVKQITFQLNRTVLRPLLTWQFRRRERVWGHQTPYSYCALPSGCVCCCSRMLCTHVDCRFSHFNFNKHSLWLCRHLQSESAILHYFHHGKDTCTYSTLVK